MRIKPLLLIIFNLSLAFAFEINGTNVIFQFENPSLNEATKEIIHTDLLRRIAPTLNDAYISQTNIDGNEKYTLEDLSFCSPTPLSPAETLTTDLIKEGTNFVLKVDNEVISQYLSCIQLYNANANAIAKAWAWADYLNNADIKNMSKNKLKNLRLFKGYEPDELPDFGIEQIRKDFQRAHFFHPSIAEFQMIESGPNNGTYLWGILPYNKDNRTHAVPIIYVNDKWMISFWMYEESLLGM